VCDRVIAKAKLSRHIISHCELPVIAHPCHEFILFDVRDPAPTRKGATTVVVALLTNDTGWVAVHGTHEDGETRYWLRCDPPQDIESVQFVTGDMGEELTRRHVKKVVHFGLGTWAGYFPAFSCRVELGIK
jgi:hypothetical protein